MNLLLIFFTLQAVHNETIYKFLPCSSNRNFLTTLKQFIYNVLPFLFNGRPSNSCGVGTVLFITTVIWFIIITNNGIQNWFNSKQYKNSIRSYLTSFLRKFIILLMIFYTIYDVKEGQVSNMKLDSWYSGYTVLGSISSILWILIVCIK